MKIFSLGIILSSILLLPQLAVAKRGAPKDVPAVVSGGIKYIAPDVMPKYRSIYGESKCLRSGGCVEARDRQTGKLLWQVEVYQTKYDPNLEQDVQVVYINYLKIDRGKLIIKNEQGDRYMVDLKTRALKKY
jgi:hypothetical protein